MGISNPGARGYASAYHGKITNQFTAGGNKKAGMGGHTGMGQFAQGAISIRAPQTIPPPQLYPFPKINQIGGVGHPRWGMFNPSADGTSIMYAAQEAKIRAGPPGWGLF